MRPRPPARLRPPVRRAGGSISRPPRDETRRLMTPAFHDNEGPPLVGYFTYSLVVTLVLVGRDVRPARVRAGRGHALHRRPSCSPAPRDRPGVYEVLDNAMRAATPFACYHRVIDRDGQSTPSSSSVVASATTVASWSSWRATSSTSHPAPASRPRSGPLTRSEVESSVAWEAGFRPRSGSPMVARAWG